MTILEQLKENLPVETITTVIVNTQYAWRLKQPAEPKPSYSLALCFSFSKTKEGFKFWHKIYRSLLKKEHHKQN